MVTIEGLPKKERLMVSQLRDFIDNDTGYTVALISGIRRTGKSTILKQLKEYYYPDAVYIDLSIENTDIHTIESQFLDDPTSLLLLEELRHTRNTAMSSRKILKITYF